MAGTFTICGKQILLDGKDFAQGRSTEAAQLILLALHNLQSPKELPRG